ncbi:DnaD domain protein [Shouchella patagoniensis]|uniref:DnaD domain protein n=1 Tax=Shouchella patagoniensis TaxID=228576 RepID=UPI0009949602|nr:DnaD domain protein [Shouchella patagoniensis]
MFQELYVQFVIAQQRQTFSKSAIVLYEALLYQACVRDAAAFAWPTANLLATCGICRSTLYRCRGELVEAGLIQFEPCAKKAAFYTLLTEAECVDDSHAQMAQETVVESVSRPSENAMETVAQPRVDMVQATMEKRVNQTIAQPVVRTGIQTRLKNSCLKELDLKEHKNKTTTTTTSLKSALDRAGFTQVAKASLAELDAWLEEPCFLENRAMVEKAIELAASAPTPSFNYVWGVLKSWKAKGIQTMAEVTREQDEWQQMKWKRKQKKGKSQKREEERRVAESWKSIVEQYPEAVF